METYITIDVITWVSLIVCFILCGTVFGIYFELSNYRKNIKENMDFLESTRKEINQLFERNEFKISDLEGKIEYLEMYITSRKS